jgi:hypothetical protein
MKLIAKSGGIAALSVIQDEVRPLKGVSLPTMLEAITARYSFERKSSIEEVNKSGARFYNGYFLAKKIAIIELAIFSDAIHVTTTDTADSETVQKDVAKWLIAEFKFREPTTKPRRAYQSDLVVDFENNPDRALQLFKPLTNYIQTVTNEVNGENRTQEFSRIDFGTDPSISGANVSFLIERRAGVPWSTNRFFCKAHMQTDRHYKALILMDKLLV